jgi:hypothetical protein
MEADLPILLPGSPVGTQVEFDVDEEVLCKIYVMVLRDSGLFTEETLASLLFPPA